MFRQFAREETLVPPNLRTTQGDPAATFIDALPDCPVAFVFAPLHFALQRDSCRAPDCGTQEKAAQHPCAALVDSVVTAQASSTS
jgi:hypothetical protein